MWRALKELHGLTHFIQLYFEMSDDWNDNDAGGASWDTDKKDEARWGRKPEGTQRNDLVVKYFITG